MGAFIPGVLVVLSYIVILWFMGRFVKGTTVEVKAATRDAAVAEYGKIGAGIAGLALILLVIGVIFGGIYAGVMTANEAGAMAALVALIMGTATRKLDGSALKRSLNQTVKITAMVMIIVVGAQIFGRFVALSMLPRYVVGLLEPLMAYPYVVALLVLIIYFVLAMFIEAIAIMVMTLPVLLPVMLAAGLDMTWIGVMVSLMLVYGLLTPPLGLSLYAVQGATGMPISGLMRYCMVFAVVSAVICVPLCLVFPQLISWLPSMMITW
ncbi:Sialic acid TRAP transporter permease protein SiaT [subsurface metagenome]